jgi:hypothetical protein
MARDSPRLYSPGMAMPVTHPPDYLAIGVALLALSLFLRKYAR